ncbi:MAG TPA: response regulator [Candidatus Omnitrophota bacterium]|nr:response regulator [Candidatus Omnitrophota bacterium]HPT06904.1 response regulator [Candidatus Omnitrophota bacterium]
MKRVLIVDDDINMHVIYQDTFAERSDIQIVSAYSVAKALEYLGKEIIDLIVLDIIMEPISGSYLYLKLTQDKTIREKKIPIIISSVLGDKGLKHIKKSQFLAIIEKPFERDAFLLKVDQLLGNVQPRKK